ncbi:MAG TPA: serine hydrolase [Polyangiaceae bacterium]|nr:serine hydrolase [Polyangiaceae bacterium]
MTRRTLGRRDVVAGLSAVTALGLLGCGKSDAPDEPADAGAGPTPTPTGSTPTPPPGGDYFPPNDSDVWETADAAATGWSASGLDALVKVVEANKSSSFMMLADGRVLLERYFLTATAATRTDVASVQKSFTSTLAGLARDRKLLTFDDKVSDHLPAGWSKAAPADEARITLRHLMTHASGLDPNTLAKVAEPGARFDYNTNAYQKLRAVLEKVSAKDINALSREWLFDAIGVRGTWVNRGLVDPVGAAIWGLELSARDMARFGLLATRGGAWSGKAVTAAGWFSEAWTPSATKADYGLLWWLQGRGTLKGKAPADLASALGAKDQKIYVVPSMKLVVTRQGLAAGTAEEAESDFDRVLLKAIADARA